MPLFKSYMDAVVKGMLFFSVCRLCLTYMCDVVLNCLETNTYMYVVVCFRQHMCTILNNSIHVRLQCCSYGHVNRQVCRSNYGHHIKLVGQHVG